MSIEIKDSGNQKSKQEINNAKKIRVQKLKENIMSQYRSISSSFNLNEDQDEEPPTAEKETCSICSISRKKEVLSYPLYIYRTKFPFIIDKPPLIQIQLKDAIREPEVFENDSFVSVDNEPFNEQVLVDPDIVFARIINDSPDLNITNDLDEDEIQHRRFVQEMIHQNLVKHYKENKQRLEEERKKRQNLLAMNIQMQKDEQLKKLTEMPNSDQIVSKRCTSGNLFVIQFGLCQHLVHHDCVATNNFTCLIERTFKNGFLPNIDDLPIESIYSDDENLTDELKEALSSFIGKYTLFFTKSTNRIVDLFVEFVKSISGLIATFEIRLRSLPGCLDSKKTKILSRNLFLAAWYAYRMKGKPVMKDGFEDDVVL